jgi:DNA polymerase-4
LEFGRLLQKQVADEVRLPVSVGLAGSRMMAKIASAHGKPGGVVWISPGREEEFISGLPIRKLPGVGHKTAEVLGDMNIRTIDELRRLSRASLRAMFGLRGEVLYERCRGRDVESRRAGTRPRTISRETTFHSPEQDPAQVQGMIHYLLERAMRAMRQQGLMAKCVELTIRYDDWRARSAARSLADPSDDDDVMLDAALGLLGRLHTRRVALRHVGIVLSNFSPASEAATLFEHERRTKAHDIYRALDSIRDRWGHAAIVTGKSIELLGKIRQDDYGFILRTPSLTK